MSNFRRRLMDYNPPSSILKINKSNGEIIKEDNTNIFNNLLSQFRRCLCKKTKDGGVSICFLDNSNSNKYYDGTSANLSEYKTDVMVYFPEFWYFGEEDDNYYIWHFSLENKKGYNHVKSSLVGAYLIKIDYSSIYSNMIATEPVLNYNQISEIRFNIEKRGTGYHIMDYQQHCIIAFMFYIKYNTLSCRSKCGEGSEEFPIGYSNNTGMADSTNNSDKVTFLGLEHCWIKHAELIEGIGGYNNKITIYDKGYYGVGNIDYENKRIYDLPLKGYALTIYNGSHIDLFPKTSGNLAESIFEDYYNIINKGTSAEYFCFRGIKSIGSSGVTSLGILEGTSSYVSGARICFDGEIEIVNDVTTFKNISAL